MLARPPAKAIYLPPTSLFHPTHPTFSIPPKRLYYSVSRGHQSTDLRAPKIWPVLVAVLTSTGYFRDQYYLLWVTSTARRSDQYWLLSRPILVGGWTYIDSFSDLYSFTRRPI